MPPEVKPVISSLAEMTCENCVFSVRSEEDNEEVECQCMDSDSWSPLKSEFCDKGQWLWLGVWSSIADDRPTLHLFHYEELYEMFARGW